MSKFRKGDTVIIKRRIDRAGLGWNYAMGKYLNCKCIIRYEHNYYKNAYILRCNNRTLPFTWPSESLELYKPVGKQLLFPFMEKNHG